VSGEWAVICLGHYEAKGSFKLLLVDGALIEDWLVKGAVNSPSFYASLLNNRLLNVVVYLTSEKLLPYLLADC
jgi:hypothetical protein